MSATQSRGRSAATLHSLLVALDWIPVEVGTSASPRFGYVPSTQAASSPLTFGRYVVAMSSENRPHSVPVSMDDARLFQVTVPSFQEDPIRRMRTGLSLSSGCVTDSSANAT